jgi:hypothetical protein
MVALGMEMVVLVVVLVARILTRKNRISFDLTHGVDDDSISEEHFAPRFFLMGLALQGSDFYC